MIQPCLARLVEISNSSSRLRSRRSSPLDRPRTRRAAAPPGCAPTGATRGCRSSGSIVQFAPCDALISARGQELPEVDLEDIARAFEVQPAALGCLLGQPNHLVTGHVQEPRPVAFNEQLAMQTAQVAERQRVGGGRGGDDGPVRTLLILPLKKPACAQDAATFCASDRVMDSLNRPGSSWLKKSTKSCAGHRFAGLCLQDLCGTTVGAAHPAPARTASASIGRDGASAAQNNPQETEDGDRMVETIRDRSGAGR